MAHHVVLWSIFALGRFQTGAALIQTQQTVLAAVGEEALLGCKFMQPEDVLQVTWQKVLPDKNENMATYHKDFGQRVNRDFRGKVQFKVAELKNTSIIIRNVVDQDEGCYLCLFNTYTFGAFTGKTCLQVYELHEPVLHVRRSNFAEEPVVSCSTTGRPAPTVTLSVTQPDLYLSNYTTVSVKNTNATVSVFTTAVLSGFHNNNVQVGCAVRVLSAPQKQVFLLIPKISRTFSDGSDEKPGAKNRHFRCSFAVLALSVSCCVGAVIAAKVQERIKASNQPGGKSEQVYPEEVKPNRNKTTSPEESVNFDQCQPFCESICDCRPTAETD